MLLTAIAKKLKMKDMKDEHQLEMCWNEGDDDMLVVDEEIEDDRKKVEVEELWMGAWFHNRIVIKTIS